MSEKKLTYARLREILSYNPQTGFFTRLVWQSPNAQAGDIAGSEWSKRTRPDFKYCVVSIDGRKYPAHRLAFFYVTGQWPRAAIDHIDHNGLNNMWSNLREATMRENTQNMRIRNDNTSGFKGVSWSPERLKWCAYITIDGKRITLGRHDRIEDAVAAYQKKAREHFGEFAYLGDEVAAPENIVRLRKRSGRPRKVKAE